MKKPPVTRKRLKEIQSSLRKRFGVCPTCIGFGTPRKPKTKS